VSEQVFDFNQHLIEVGTEVICNHPGIVGKVISVSESDGDAGKYGPVAVYPKLEVRWPSGLVEVFTTYPGGKAQFERPSEVFVCDDLSVKA
jgi:hypothetical protein